MHKSVELLVARDHDPSSNENNSSVSSKRIEEELNLTRRTRRGCKFNESDKANSYQDNCIGTSYTNQNQLVISRIKLNRRRNSFEADYSVIWNLRLNEKMWQKIKLINMMILVCVSLICNSFSIQIRAEPQEGIDILRRQPAIANYDQQLLRQHSHEHHQQLPQTLVDSNQILYESTRNSAPSTSVVANQDDEIVKQKNAATIVSSVDKRIGNQPLQRSASSLVDYANNINFQDGEHSMMNNHLIDPSPSVQNIATRAHNTEPMAVGPPDQNSFRRINELESFLDEMNHNELRDVAAGRPIDNELFQPKALTENNQNGISSGKAEQDAKRVDSSVRGASNLDTAQSTDRSSSYSDCALILQRTYVKTGHEDQKHHPLMGLPFGRTEQACIGYKHINKAIEQAKHKLKFRDQQMAALKAGKKKRQPMGELGAGGGDPLHSSLEPPSDLIAALGEINMATTQILADQFDLSNDELLNGLPLIDMSKTNFWPICPLLVRQNVQCQVSRFRTMTGHCNNLKHPTWGAAMTPFARYLPPIHPDGIWTPRKSIVSELTFHLERVDASGHARDIPPPPHAHGSIQRPAFVYSQHEPDNSMAASRQHHQRNSIVESRRHEQHLAAAAAAANLIGAASTSGENVIDTHYQRLQSEGRIYDAASDPSGVVRDHQLNLIHKQQEAGHNGLIWNNYEPRLGLEHDHHHGARSGKSAPAELPPVRLISTVVHHDVDLPNHDFSILFMSWGQLLDHDMTRAAQPPSSIKCCEQAKPETLLNGLSAPQAHKHKLCLPIKIPEHDPFYAKFNVNCLEFRRSLAGLRPNCVLGPRVHQNAITSPIDANFVYGSSEAESSGLRLFRGGRLRDRDWFKHQNLKPLLPAQEEEPDQDCLGRPKDLFCFLAGDVRANEQIHLTVLHTLYMREHNRIADKLAHLNPHWNDERIYQETRHIVAASVQQVMISEYIPLLIGKKMASLYNLTGQAHNSHQQDQPVQHEASSTAYWHGYDPSVTTSVSNSFAAAAFRQGHTFIQSTVERYNKFHEFIGSEKLRHLFKQPFLLYQAGALDELTSGLINQPAQSYDPFISAEIAGHLFQPPERQFGHDLASINLQRGREQGLPGYNLFREWCGLPRAETFEQLAPFLTNHTAFLYSRLYKHVDDIDLWSGGISERKLPGAAIGPTFACIIARQFSNTRRGDRFWFENPGFPSSFTPEQLAQIRKITLAKILCANSDDLPTIQRWALRMAHPILNPRLQCSQIPQIDLRFWQED